MFLTTRLGFAAAGTLLALNTACIPACADDLIQTLGSVGPYHTILTEVGSKSIIAFYEPNQWPLRFPRDRVGHHRRQR